MNHSSLLPNYARQQIAFSHGKGSYLYSTNGDSYLDFASGIAVTAMGHNHPALVAALTEQAQKLWHVSNLFIIPEQEALANKLCQESFADLVFIANSGAEALECAIKMTRKYFASRNQPERHRIITFQGAFHGRTLATLAAGGNAKYLDGFAPDMPGFDHLPFGDLAAVEAAITANTAAILIEPIQGEGGVRVATREFLLALRKLADDCGLLLIFDEVQCGLGRSGSLFAYQQAGVAPDILCLAKALGGGFPISACLASQDAAGGMKAGSHGSTFGGNPLGCVIALKVLDLMTADGFLKSVQQRGEQFRLGLTKIITQHHNQSQFTEVRGQGLMIGLKCQAPVAEIQAALIAKKLLAVGASDNVLRLLPPLTVSAAEIDQALAIIAEVAAATAP
ncbi:MAG: aspartate aminotransferase family protein [Candidatus Pacebacteria bacterium]|nr:aspartate aminotransferase family protein [Candidatus Paceibacterota bacterium]